MKIRPTSVLFAAWFLLSAEYATADERPNRKIIPNTPSISTDSKTTTGVDIERRLRWGFLCYAYRHGRPADCKLRNFTLGTVEEADTRGIVTKECDFMFGQPIPTTCGNGGHDHIGFTRERLRLRVFSATDHDLTIGQEFNDQPALEFTSVDNAPFARFTVIGDLPSPWWSYINGPAPDNAGSFYWRMEVDGPPCTFLPQYCGFRGLGAQDDRSYLADGVVNVRFDCLRQLPDDPTLYRKVRGRPAGTPPGGDDARHSDAVAFFGTATAVSAVRLISREYFTNTGNRLQPNDMSLPYGGLFDVAGDYRYEEPVPGGTNIKNGHRSHRDGIDVDFNRRVQLPGGGPSNPVNCNVDKDFHEAVHAVLAPVQGRSTRAGARIVGQGGVVLNPFTAIDCENGRRKHIDITNILNVTPPPP